MTNKTATACLTLLLASVALTSVVPRESFAAEKGSGGGGGRQKLLSSFKTGIGLLRKGGSESFQSISTSPSPAMRFDPAWGIVAMDDLVAGKLPFFSLHGQGTFLWQNGSSEYRIPNGGSGSAVAFSAKRIESAMGLRYRPFMGFPVCPLVGLGGMLGLMHLQYVDADFFSKVTGTPTSKINNTAFGGIYFEGGIDVNLGPVGFEGVWTWKETRTWAVATVDNTFLNFRDSELSFLLTVPL